MDFASAPEARNLLQALRDAVRRPDPKRIDALEAAIRVFRAALGDTPPRCAGCPVCGGIPDSGYSLGTAANPDSLHEGCYRVIPATFLSADRCYEELRCPSCGMGYVYERDYEYLAGGSEDEETFTRLHIPFLLRTIEARLPWVRKYHSASDLDDDLRHLESAFRMA